MQGGLTCFELTEDKPKELAINMEGRVAVVTGGNSGLGLAVAERLLELYPSIHICLACRNKERAQKAALSLKEKSPNADITLLLVDISNMSSVYKAAEELKKRYEHIDYLYLNAGIMPVTTVNWENFFKGFFSKKCAHMLTTGEGLLKQQDGKTTDGLQSTFATNLFGHFVLVKELLGVSLGGHIASQVIWTSSSNANQSAFQLDDMQHKKGTEPYSSSKFASDAISVVMNNKFNKQLRILVPSLNLSTYNGSEALIWSTQKTPESMDPMSKYCSRTSVFGGRYVKPRKMSIPIEFAEKIYDSLDKMEIEFNVNKS